jgi:transcriptional regulator with XRE-family HTH domain
MRFGERLSIVRKERGITQQVLADAVGVHVTQLRRYEAGTSQPTVEVLRKLALALRTSADALLFDDHERGPEDDFRLQFEAIARLGDREKDVIREVLEGMLIKHEADHWRRARETASSASGE